MAYRYRTVMLSASVLSFHVATPVRLPSACRYGGMWEGSEATVPRLLYRLPVSESEGHVGGDASRWDVRVETKQLHQKTKTTKQ